LEFHVPLPNNCQVPEIVTPYSLKDLQELVATGPDKFPGALYVIKDNIRENLRYVKDRCEIYSTSGDQVEWLKRW
jgi:hypothetical protein